MECEEGFTFFYFVAHLVVNDNPNGVVNGLALLKSPGAQFDRSFSDFFRVDPFQIAGTRGGNLFDELCGWQFRRFIDITHIASLGYD